MDNKNPTIGDMVHRHKMTGFSPIIKQSDGKPCVVGYENLDKNRRFFL